MIQVHQVTKSYKNFIALNDINLNISKGEIYALLGPNGAGKTTTINLILGFLTPDSGSISVAGLNPSKNKTDVRKTMAYIPENVSLYPHLSGIENLDYFCKLAGLKYGNDALRGFLNQCGLQEEAHQKKVAGYSKGMRQKVGIAIALAKNASVLLLDEPASGLDPSASSELSALLKKLATDGTTILMASHDLFRVRETANRIGILNQGKLVKELDAKSVSANDLESIYLNFMKN
ncbi:MAG: ABC transporter ATP-binding protein [Flavobacteriales bacterium]|nr:ABC transporter ATP-binding protein [Flavobacteriales bacterium]